VQANKIENIKIISHNEDGIRHYGSAMERIPQAITDSQNTDVDVVSGATYTSKGIMNAVQDALSKAVINQK
ncbi:MAG: FMN-binding protein, partial [Paraclostridium sp.]